MAQLVLAKPTQILPIDATESTVLDENWVGEFQVTLYTAGTDPVKIEKLKPETEDTWIVTRFNGSEIELSTEGDTLDVFLTKGDSYRLVTATAGAEVWIMSH